MRRRPSPPHTPMMILTDGLLLLLALFSVAFSVTTAYHIDTEAPALALGAAALAALALLLASLPKYKLPLTLTALAAWGWGLWRWWDEMVLGGTRIGCDVYNALTSNLPGVAPIVPVARLEPELWPRYVTLWLLMVGAAYALLLGFLLCRLRAAAPVILFTLLPILPALCFTQAPDPLPMLGLLSVWGTLLLTSMAGRRDSRGAARLRPAALLSCVLVLGVLSRSVPLSGMVPPSWAGALREEAVNAAWRLDLSSLSGLWPGRLGSGSGRYVDLTAGGVYAAGRTALRVETDAPAGKYYLRGYASDVYTGESWEPLDRETRKELEALLAEEDGQPLLALGEAVQASGIARVTTDAYDYSIHLEPAAEATMTIENVSAPGGCVYYPYALSRIPEGAAPSGDVCLERQGRGWTRTVSFYPGEYGENAFFQRWLGEPGGAYEDFVHAHQLQVPEALRADLLSFLDQWEDEYSLLGVRSPEDYARVNKLLSSGWENGATLTYRDGRYFLVTGDRVEAFHSLSEVARRLGVEVTQEEVESFQPLYARGAALVVTNILSRAASYDRSVGAPPEGEDYVNWFLTGSQRGY